MQFWGIGFSTLCIRSPSKFMDDFFQKTKIILRPQELNLPFQERTILACQPFHDAVAFKIFFEKTPTIWKSE